MTVSIIKMTEDKFWSKSKLAAPGSKYKKQTKRRGLKATLMTVSIIKMTEDKHWLKSKLAAPGGKVKKMYS
ncbi:hypothetical protein NY70_004525 [Salmonella enterica subsp. enterica]|nr:hypothetical protein [Salmonella enterica subsp. enterica]